MRRILLPLGAALVLMGCPDPRLVKTLPPGVRIDTYEQQAASKVDVLWVIDNSGSMASRQENLAKNFQSFIDLFSKGAVDFRIAVTTTDIFKDQGQFKGTPRILTPTTPNLAAAFSTNIKVGITGSPYEAGLQAAQMAIERQAKTNEPKVAQIESCQNACKGDLRCIEDCPNKTPIDFLRPGAFLYLVFVTDEEDRSGQDFRYFYRAFETAKGVGNDATVTTAAIVGLPRNSCGATVGSKYLELSQLTGGEVGSICDASFAETLRKLATNAVGLKRKFRLAVKPNESTLKLTLRYPCNAPTDATSTCAEVNRDACTGAPAESMNVLCVPRQGSADGWSYEPETNVIFFAGESVPGLRSSLEIEYYEEGYP
jgi:hypothetical protein